MKAKQRYDVTAKGNEQLSREAWEAVEADTLPYLIRRDDDYTEGAQGIKNTLAICRC